MLKAVHSFVCTCTYILFCRSRPIVKMVALVTKREKTRANWEERGGKREEKGQRREERGVRTEEGQRREERGGRREEVEQED